MPAVRGPRLGGRWSRHRGVLADVRTTAVGAHERRAVRTLMRRRPDVIVIAGDRYQGDQARFADRLEALRELLAGLEVDLVVSGHTHAGQVLTPLVPAADHPV